ncbi:hypothetical protein PUV54_00225 [Hyphococcus flavus]|uniref:Uncharacterized protein n=1 Tax=Hyphococcus flavus TaxID=1866326 RepID=A0AAF0CFP7_9PROT|nr:hypothetical protein [Hyphococcus flavus]WDI31619.1 hypothetical protein PUV54_00225 [Hyphococcus flavus]
MSDPILFTHDGAREYLSGANPDTLTPPIILGRRRFYSRAALDRAVKEKAGLPIDDGGRPAPADVYDQWKKNCA